MKCSVTIGSDRSLIYYTTKAGLNRQFFSLGWWDFRNAQELILIKHYIFDILDELLNDKLTKVLETYF